MKFNLLFEYSPIDKFLPVVPQRRLSGADWNNSRPASSRPLPPILDKVTIEDVWWDAPGRDDNEEFRTGQIIKGDPRIGVQINGVRKTQGGYACRGWWYILKKTHSEGDVVRNHGKIEGESTEDRFYWYRKRRMPSLIPGKMGEIKEEYVGKELREKESDSIIILPDILKDKIDFELEKMWKKEERNQ